jgi:cytochrome c peroxidase
MCTPIKLVACFAAIVLWGCADQDASPQNDAYAFLPPATFPAVAYTLENNPVTRDGFELGRALFYDPILSVDSSIACANCHQQARAFSDPVHRFSKGVGEASGFRNAPAIQNTAFAQDFFWDGGVKHLDFVPINAITSELEMQETLAGVVIKLQRSAFYPTRFNQAFGYGEITSQHMLQALSQFMVMMISADARYDQYLQGRESLTTDELAGLQLVQQKCSGCHATDIFTDGSFRNNGLDENFDSDAGRERITELPEDRGKFKVPSLRNVELTAPYMHDGRFGTLTQVLGHYNTGVKTSETLDPLLTAGSLPGIALSATDQQQIIAFLKTLTDRTFTKDPRFSNPFKVINP